MLRVLISGIWTAANTLLNHNDTPTADQQRPSKWRTFRNFLATTMSTLGIPLLRSFTANDTLFEYVNTCLASSTTVRTDHRQQHNTGINRLSRPRFRRRAHHHGGVVRIVKPTIHIHLNQS